MCVCVFVNVRVRECVRACVNMHVHVREGACARRCVCVKVCVRNRRRTGGTAATERGTSRHARPDGPRGDVILTETLVQNDTAGGNGTANRTLHQAVLGSLMG